MLGVANAVVHTAKKTDSAGKIFIVSGTGGETTDPGTLLLELLFLSRRPVRVFRDSRYIILVRVRESVVSYSPVVDSRCTWFASKKTQVGPL